MAEHNRTGKIGESTVVEYLKSKKFSIVERNYNRKWGEIDIVAKRKERVHFIEVKATSVTRETAQKDGFRPIEKVDKRKLKRLARAIQTFSGENNIELEVINWQCDIYVVYLDQERGEAELEVLEDVIVPE